MPTIWAFPEQHHLSAAHLEAGGRTSPLRFGKIDDGWDAEGQGALVWGERCSCGDGVGRDCCLTRRSVITAAPTRLDASSDGGDGMGGTAQKECIDGEHADDSGRVDVRAEQTSLLIPHNA